jgi:SanA protein
MRKRRIVLFAFLFLVVVSVCTLYVCNRVVENAAAGKLYSDTKDLPFHKVGLLLGTAKYFAGGHLNPYYTSGIEAAATLLRAGKIKYIIVSGDNGRIDYNEPELMRADLMNAGIDSSLIYLDYAGFRTFDSMVRLREVFSQHEVTVISQPFHNERALYIASKEGIDAVGFNARDVSMRSGLRVQMREKLARVKVFVDYLIGKEPKFLGQKVSIPS